MKITMDKLRKMSSEERHTLWQNAKSRVEKHPDAEALVDMIENCGLDYKPNKKASITLDSKIGRTMARIIRSKAGIEAMLVAVSKGLPALAGVDPMLREALGSDYSKDNEATIQAGYLVTGAMEGLGYKKGPQRPLPANCIARSGVIFRRVKN